MNFYKVNYWCRSRGRRGYGLVARSTTCRPLTLSASSEIGTGICFRCLRCLRPTRGPVIRDTDRIAFRSLSFVVPPCCMPKPDAGLTLAEQHSKVSSNPFARTPGKRATSMKRNSQTNRFDVTARLRSLHMNLLCISVRAGSRVPRGRPLGQHAAVAHVLPPPAQQAQRSAQALLHGARAGHTRRCELTGTRKRRC